MEMYLWLKYHQLKKIDYKEAWLDHELEIARLESELKMANSIIKDYSKHGVKRKSQLTSLMSKLESKVKCLWTRAFDGHFNISCPSGERANGT